jgi:hypothetical protein
MSMHRTGTRTERIPVCHHGNPGSASIELKGRKFASWLSRGLTADSTDQARPWPTRMWASRPWRAWPMRERGGHV